MTVPLTEIAQRPTTKLAQNNYNGNYTSKHTNTTHRNKNWIYSPKRNTG